MSLARNPSLSAWSTTRACSSEHSSACRPSARSAAIRSSSASRRSSSRRLASLSMGLVSELGERRAAPERERLAEVRGCPLGTPRGELSLPSLRRCSKRARSSSRSPTSRRYPPGSVNSLPAPSRCAAGTRAAAACCAPLPAGDRPTAPRSGELSGPARWRAAAGARGECAACARRAGLGLHHSRPRGARGRGIPQKPQYLHNDRDCHENIMSCPSRT